MPTIFSKPLFVTISNAVYMLFSDWNGLLINRAVYFKWLQADPNTMYVSHIKTPLILETEYSGLFDQCHACWCPVSITRQALAGMVLTS